MSPVIQNRAIEKGRAEAGECVLLSLSLTDALPVSVPSELLKQSSCILQSNKQVLSA